MLTKPVPLLKRSQFWSDLAEDCTAHTLHMVHAGICEYHQVGSHRSMANSNLVHVPT